MPFKWNNILGGDAAEVGSGPGSYDIRKSVWHVNVSRLTHSLFPLGAHSKYSAAMPSSMVVVGGASSTPYLAGRIPQHTVPLSHTTYTG